jgi:LmbE family N-acetylglucosaminyl deacetylase
MRYMFFFAHPDDETIGTTSTMKKLTDQGDEVIVVTATDGAAGEVHERSKKDLEKFGTLAKLRRHELEQVSKLLGVKESLVLDFQDGEMTNKQVWGELTSTFIDLIDTYKPDFVVTFDHSGWYFHLDHVGVSIATTLAFHQSTHRPEALLLSYVQVEGSKWKYVFPTHLPITHVVDASDHKELKIQALELHASQDVEKIKEKVRKESPHRELFQLVFATEKGEKIMKKHPIFQSLHQK